MDKIERVVGMGNSVSNRDVLYIMDIACMDCIRGFACAVGIHKIGVQVSEVEKSSRTTSA